MSWDKESLWTKSRLYFERAFEESREDPLFGFWCSLGLELLARAAVASVSPALLAEPDPDHKNLLYALKVKTAIAGRKSLAIARVLNLCTLLFPTFSEEDRKVALALVNRRNDELHSGTSAFTEYPAKDWLVDFYRACRSLAESMGESLEGLFGKEEASVAAEALSQSHTEVMGKVMRAIATQAKAFATKTPEERVAAADAAKVEGDQLAHKRHHRVTCPACGSVATVQGEPFGPEKVIHEDGTIVVRRAVSPRSFSCPACSLKLQGYPELEVAGVGGQYTRTTEFSPGDYYGLIDPEDKESLSPYLEEQIEERIEEHMRGLAEDAAFDNE
jgi:hypothetical protein